MVCLPLNFQTNDQDGVDRSRLKVELDQKQQQLNASKEKELEAHRRIAELVEKVERAETNARRSSQQLTSQQESLLSMTNGKVSAIIVCSNLRI